MTVQALPVDRLIPTPDNRRDMHAAREHIAELSASILARGQLLPGIARPHPTQPGYYDLRAGACRLAAIIAAGLPTMAVDVRDLTDAEAAQVTVVENLLRRNLTAMEEADDVVQLLEAGQTPEQIAAVCGKSVRWVLRRAEIGKLPDGWEQFDAPVGALELIARYPATVCDALYDRLEADEDFARVMFHQSGLSTLRAYLARLTTRLDEAPFDLDDAPGCHGCTKRTACAPDLFDADEVADGDRCLDVACFERKRTAHALRAEALLRDQYPKAARLSILERPGAGVLGFGKYREVREGSKGARPAIWTDGPKAGSLAWVEAPEKPAAVKRLAVALPVSDPEAIQRAAFVLESEKRLLRVPVPKTAWLVSLAAVFGAGESPEYPSPEHWEHVAKLGAAALWDRVRGVIMRRISNTSATEAERYEEAVRVCRYFGLPVEEIEKRAERSTRKGVAK